MSDPTTNEPTGPITFNAPEPLHPVTEVPGDDQPAAPPVKTRAELLADEQTNLDAQQVRLDAALDALAAAKARQAATVAKAKAEVDHATGIVRGERQALHERQAIVRSLTPRTRKAADPQQGSLDGTR